MRDSETDSYQIIHAVEEMKANIEQLKIDISEAKKRQSEASKDIKRIEKDMKEFNDNKDSKLAELQASLDSLKKGLTKNSIAAKTLQKELQASRLDSEQVGSDLSAAEEQLAEADATLKSQLEDIESLKREQARLKVMKSVKCRTFEKPTNHTYPRMLMTSPKPNSTMRGPS